MGERLYGRQAKLTLALPIGASFTDTDGANVIEINGGSTDRPGLRIVFHIEKDSKKDPNTSQIIVTNLSPTRRSDLQKKGVRVTMDAGYQATGLSRIFLGDARTIDHVRNGPDWDSTMKLGDGERAMRYARLSESFAGGTGAGDVLLALANASGLAIGNVPTAVLNLQKTFDQGYAVSGPVSRSIDTLVKSLGYTWSIQYGTLQVLAPNSSLQAEVLEISPDTGLIGSPEMGTPEKKGGARLLKFKALLFPANPGVQVKLRSKRYNGMVAIRKAILDGDTHGQDWYAECFGVVVGGS